MDITAGMRGLDRWSPLVIYLLSMAERCVGNEMGIGGLQLGAMKRRKMGQIFFVFCEKTFLGLLNL